MPLPDISLVLPNILILGIIAGVVQWLRSTGRIDSADAPGASAISGLVLGILLGVAGGHPVQQLIYDAIIGIGLGLATTGFYAVASKIGGNQSFSGSAVMARRLARNVPKP